MGGDFGPEVIIPAALLVLKEKPGVELILVGQEEVLSAYFRDHNISQPANLHIQHASEVVTMDEAPSQALRKKKDSSLRVAINLVHQGKANAAVSAGNTGALMATAKFVLKTLPGIDRPAIMTTLPSMTGHTHMQDLSVTIHISAEIQHMSMPCHAG